MESHLVLRYAKSSGMRLRSRRTVQGRPRAFAIHLGGAQPRPAAIQEVYDSTMNAPGRKRLMPDTPDRESSAPKRRRLIPTNRGTQGVPPEMVSQIANFRLVGSPKRKAYKPRKRAQVGEGKYFCVSLKES